MNEPDLSRMTPQALKCYHEGLALVKKKLAACHKPTPAEREAETIRRGNAEIVRKFGSEIALKKFNIASPCHVPSPAERLDRIATAAADRALKKFMEPAKPSPAKPAAKESTPKIFKTAERTIHRFAACSFAGTRMAI